LEELLGGPVRDDSDEGAAFFRTLRSGLDAGGGSLLALATLRSDFLGDFQSRAELSGFNFANIPLGPLPRERFAEVIEGPAERAGIEIEEGLVEEMVEDAETEHALPLLAYTLQGMYEICRRNPASPRSFTHALYHHEEIGGIKGVVQRTADRIEVPQEAERDL